MDDLMIANMTVKPDENGELSVAVSISGTENYSRVRVHDENGEREGRADLDFFTQPDNIFVWFDDGNNYHVPMDEIIVLE